MGGRRSRYWCGPGIFRETKKAPVRGFIGQWSAPAFLNLPHSLKRLCGGFVDKLYFEEGPYL
jgi:hypothetical protein